MLRPSSPLTLPLPPPLLLLLAAACCLSSQHHRVDAFAVSLVVPPSAAAADLPANQAQRVHVPSSSHLTTGIRSYVRDLLVPPAYAADTMNTAPAAAEVQPPTAEEVSLLRSALAAFYGQPRDSPRALELLARAVDSPGWRRQNPDERAALYRVRGDVDMDLRRPEEAVVDYGTTIGLLEGPGGERADEGELPAARLGRARAMRGAILSGTQSLTKEEWSGVAQDYQVALRLTSRDDYLETDVEREQDGAARNPYAAWEWGQALRGAGRYGRAAEVHALAALSFRDIGDRARGVIAELDAGIDLAAAAAAPAAAGAAAAAGDDAATSTNYYKDARELLEKDIPKTTGITTGTTDVELLQRVIAKEGEARIALAATLLWNDGNGDKASAERQLGEACVRFDQLEADNADREAARMKKGLMPPLKYNRVLFSIDDIAGAAAGGKVSCARFRDDEFLTRTVEWPEALRARVQKLNKLG